MAPIDNVSNIVRMPRLGKIHLGIKVEKPGQNPYPKATDYFVVPDEVAKVYTDKPKELDIMFPHEDANQFAQQWYRRYSMTQGLCCIGDGVTAHQKMDTATGAIADRKTKEWKWKDLTCDPQECPEYTEKKCRRVMNLQVLLPKVPGLGVWQIDTSSFYSIVNINSMVALLKGMLGRCSFIELKLCLGPIEVTPPGISKKTVHILHVKVREDMTLFDIVKLAQTPLAQVLLPEPDGQEAPEDLFPPGVLEERAPGEEEAIEAESHIVSGVLDEAEEALTEDREALIADINKELGVLFQQDATRNAFISRRGGWASLEDTPTEALQTLLAESRRLREEKDKRGLK